MGMNVNCPYILALLSYWGYTRKEILAMPTSGVGEVNNRVSR